ncbi:MAG: ABC transporter permease subunit, partial [Acidimicrobiales bacterium]|nr:ABC transporter permease subunit [Acidimicrobiales bacterium]
PPTSPIPPTSSSSSSPGASTLTSIGALPVDVVTTGRDRRDHVGAVRAALRSEWIKLSTLRAHKLILVATALIGAAIAFVLAATAGDEPLTAAELFIYPLPLVAMLAAVTGILMFTADDEHGLLAVALTARPSRWVIVLARTVTAAAVGLAYGATGMVAGFAGAAAGGVDLGSGSALASRAMWALLYISLAAVIGLGVGMIVRHSAGAISGLLMWSFVIESLFAPALPDGVVHLLPFSAGYRLLDAGPSFEAPVVIAHELAMWQYALVFGGYAVLSLAVGAYLLHRRDTA